MSRYVCDFLVNLSPQHVRTPLHTLLAACGLEPIYDLDDYLMAREIPGRVSFTRLVTVEVLIDVTNATDAAVKLSFVLKNEELPLKSNNHCRQIFDLLRSTIAHDERWQPLNSLQSNLPFTKAIASATAVDSATRKAIFN
jgi:hypothetical protein